MSRTLRTCFHYRLGKSGHPCNSPDKDVALTFERPHSISLAAGFTDSSDWPASWMIGFGMLGRAELAFVVKDIAYVQHQILTIKVFYTLMLIAFWLNLTVPLSIRWWKSKWGHTVESSA